MAQTLALSLLTLVLALCIPWTQGTKEGEALAGRRELKRHFLPSCLWFYVPYLAGSDGGGQDCCLKYSQRKIPYSIVRGYRKQEPSLGCTLSAIL